MRHTLMLPGIDAEMREFGQSGIRCHQRELLAANRDEIDTLLTMLKLRDDWQGRDPWPPMATSLFASGPLLRIS